MGLLSLPTPSEGVLTVLVVNTVMSVAILKQILSSALRVVGIRPSDPGSDRRPEPYCSEPSLTERFRSRSKPARFGMKRAAIDCRVCLVRFEPGSVVNRLPCGHVFHKACVERWLDFEHATCPLCRSHLLLPADDSAAAGASSSCPWF